MKTILVSGGTSGIGLEAAMQFVVRGHRVILLGRSALDGAERAAAFEEAGDRATFIAADLSTHDGVRKAAERVLAETGTLDAILHTAGVVLIEDRRTSDGLNWAFAIDYLARYHLTQLLLPALRQAERPRVIMMTAKVDSGFEIDFDQFPDFPTYKFPDTTDHMWIANLHYAAYLVRTEDRLMAGVVHPGGMGTRGTGIMRSAPWYMRLASRALGPLIMNSPRQSARNPVEACLNDGWPAPAFWEKVGNFDDRTPIAFDEAITQEVVDISHRLTGA